MQGQDSAVAAFKNDDLFPISVSFKQKANAQVYNTSTQDQSLSRSFFVAPFRYAFVPKVLKFE